MAMAEDPYVQISGMNLEPGESQLDFHDVHFIKIHLRTCIVALRLSLPPQNIARSTALYWEASWILDMKMTMKANESICILAENKI